MESNEVEKGATMNVEQTCKALEISRPTLMRRISEGVLTPLPKPKGLKRHYRLEFHSADVEKLANAAEKEVAA